MKGLKYREKDYPGSQNNHTNMGDTLKKKLKLNLDPEFLQDAIKTKKGNFLKKSEPESGKKKKSVRFGEPTDILIDDSFIGPTKLEIEEENKIKENDRRYVYLRSQYKKYIQDKIGNKLTKEEYSGTDKLFKEWGKASMTHQDAYERFFEDVKDNRLVNDEKLKKLKDFALRDKNKISASSKVINLLAGNSPNYVKEFEREGFPGNHNLENLDQHYKDSIIKIQSWWRGRLSRTYRINLMTIFQNAGEKLNWGRKIDQFLINRNAKNDLYTQEEKEVLVSNYFRKKDNEGPNLDKIRYMNITQEDINLFIREYKEDLSNEDYSKSRQYEREKDYFLRGKKLEKFNRNKLESLIEAKKRILHNHNYVHIPKNKERRFLDIILKRKLEVEGSLRLSQVDWTLDASKSKSILSKKKEVKFKKQQSIDTFRYSREHSKSIDYIEDDFPSQSNRTSFMENSVPEAISYSKSYKKSTDSIPLMLNAARSQSDDGSIPMEFDFNDGQGDTISGSEIPMHISSKQKSQSRSRFNDNIPMEIETDDDIAEEFDQDFETENSKNLDRVSGRIKLIESSGHSNSKLKQSMGKFKKFVTGSKVVFDKLNKELDSMDKYRLQELKKNQEFTEDLISKMDNFINNQKIEEKLDAILNKKIEPIIIRDVEGEKSDDELRRIMKKQMEQDEVKRREEHEENKAMLENIENRVGKKLELIFDEIRDNIHQPRGYVTQEEPKKREKKVIEGYRKEGKVFVKNEAEEPPEILLFDQMEKEFLKNFHGVMGLDESLDIKKTENMVDVAVNNFRSKIDKIDKLKGNLKDERVARENYLDELNKMIENQIDTEAAENEILERLKNETPRKEYVSQSSHIYKSSSTFKESGIMTDYSASRETMKDISWVESLSESYRY